jgi:hypothetical protein
MGLRREAGVSPLATTQKADSKGFRVTSAPNAMMASDLAAHDPRSGQPQGHLLHPLHLVDGGFQVHLIGVLGVLGKEPVQHLPLLPGLPLPSGRCQKAAQGTNLVSGKMPP